jgi:AraC-like DNA-binding protein
MAVVAVLGLEPALRTALAAGLPAGVRARACRSRDRLDRLLAAVLVDAVVLPVRGDWLPPAAALRERFPRIPVFGYGAVRADDGAQLARAVAAGVQGVLVEGVDEPVAGELVWARGASRQRARELADAPRLLRLTDTLQRQVWELALAAVDQRLTTGEVARRLGRSREHLSREFAAGGAPNLKRVIDLARVACAADLLRNPGYAVGVCAGILGFASAGHLAGTSRRIAGVASGELGRLGPRGVLQRFLRGRTRSRI